MTSDELTKALEDGPEEGVDTHERGTAHSYLCIRIRIRNHIGNTLRFSKNTGI